MRFTVDSNILAYAADPSAGDKHQIAADLMIRAIGADMVLTSQALGEFINVVRRKAPADLSSAIEQAQRWSILFSAAPTTGDPILTGASFATRHRLQFWDSVIWQSARAMGAVYFLSEDMQDGLSIDGMTVLNPLESANATVLARLLG